MKTAYQVVRTKSLIMSETNRVGYKRELNTDVDIEKEVIAFLNYHEDGKECFRFMENFTRMTFLASEELIAKDGLVEGLVDGLVESQRKIVNLIRDNPKISKKEMAEYIGISTTSVDKHIRSLKEKNFIIRVGSDRTGHWELYII